MFLLNMVKKCTSFGPSLYDGVKELYGVMDLIGGKNIPFLPLASVESR